jgi:signal transduction histidine kinase
VSLPGGIRTKLILALMLIVGGALAAAYLMIVPSLEQRLVDAKLDQLEQQARRFAPRLPSDRLEWRNWVVSVAYFTDSRVAVVSPLSENPPTLAVLQDSRETDSSDILFDPVALDAARTSKVERQRIDRPSGSYAEVAVPLTRDVTVLFSDSLADSLATVTVVKRRLLYAAAAALAIAGCLGLVAASMLARRLRRLERAAGEIAQGAFDEPVVDLGDDEIGQLAEAFDRMRRQLAQLDTARRAFVANASHELRTPLFSLAGFLELLSDEDLDEDTRRDFLRTTREQVDRLTALATDLLDLSRMDAGRFRVVQEEVDLREIASFVTDELRPLAEASGHTLMLEEGTTAWALADEERVLQVCRALARNALVHTPPGSHVVLRVGEAGGRAELSVTDDGPGVPAEHTERVFDRFYRVDSGQASGSGLGLAIARELAQHMDGSVELQSAPGHTVFTLSLPTVVAPTAGQVLVEA